MAETTGSASPQPSIEDRIASALGAGSDAPDDADQAPGQDEQQTDDGLLEAEDSQEGDDEQAPGDPGAIDVQGEDGKSYKVPAALKDAFLRREDYTRKTQETANLAKLAEDRIQYADAREKITGAVIQEFSALEGKRQTLRQLQSIDLAMLYSQDPGQALGVQQRIAAAKDEIADAERTLASKAQNLQAALRQHQDKQWQLAVEGVKQRLTVNQDEDAAMLRTVQAMGFSEAELKSRFADPRFLELVYKAAKLDSIQARKQGALQSANKAPPVVKPGASNAMSAEVRNDFAFRKAMKSARTSTDKAKIIEQRLADRFK